MEKQTNALTSTIVEIKERGLTYFQIVSNFQSTIVEIKERGLTMDKVAPVLEIYNSRN